MQAEIKGKVDDYNKLLLEKEQKHQEITTRDKEIEKLVAQIQELERSGIEVSKTVHYLEQQLQKMKKVETELKQVIFKFFLNGSGIMHTVSSWGVSMTVLQCCLRLYLAPSAELNCCINGRYHSPSFKQTLVLRTLSLLTIATAF